MRASAREAALWNLRLAQAQLSLALTRGALRGLTFELSGRRRQDARPGLAKMYRVPPDRAWWPAVGAPFERGVRPRLGESKTHLGLALATAFASFASSSAGKSFVTISSTSPSLIRVSPLPRKSSFGS